MMKFFGGTTKMALALAFSVWLLPQALEAKASPICLKILVSLIQEGFVPGADTDGSQAEAKTDLIVRTLNEETEERDYEFNIRPASEFQDPIDYFSQLMIPKDGRSLHGSFGRFSDPHAPEESAYKNTEPWNKKYIGVGYGPDNLWALDLPDLGRPTLWNFLNPNERRLLTIKLASQLQTQGRYSPSKLDDAIGGALIRNPDKAFSPLLFFRAAHLRQFVGQCRHSSCALLGTLGNLGFPVESAYYVSGFPNSTDTENGPSHAVTWINFGNDPTTGNSEVFDPTSFLDEDPWPDLDPTIKLKMSVIRKFINRKKRRFLVPINFSIQTEDGVGKDEFWKMYFDKLF